MINISSKKLTVSLIVISLLLGIFSLRIQVTKADDERQVPPSTRPADGSKARYPKEKIDITPQDAKGYKKYLNTNGTYTLVFKSSKISETPLSTTPPSNTPNKPFKTTPNTTTPTKPTNPFTPNKPAPTSPLSLSDSIALENVDGNVTTYTYPNTPLLIEYSEELNPNPPPAMITTTSRTYLKYDLGYLPEKITILGSHFDFSASTNNCSAGIDVDLYETTSSWSSSTMTWSTQPTVSKVTDFTWEYGEDGPSYVDVTGLVQTYYYTPTQYLGIRLSTETLDVNGCGINGSLPDLVITYSLNQGGSPSGHDLAFGNG